MIQTHAQRKVWFRPTALLVASSLAMPVLVGCGGPKNQSSAPPIDDTRGGRVSYSPQDQPERKGMSGKQKVVLLAGAALLYYLYKKHQANAGNAPGNEKYYLSKNGRVYYRDADHRAHWVTPPAEGQRVELSDDEAREYEKFQGYDGRNTGRDLVGLGND